MMDINVDLLEWFINLTDTQLINRYSKGFLFLLCVIDIFSKYAWVAFYKDKNGTTIINTKYFR